MLIRIVLNLFVTKEQKNESHHLRPRPVKATFTLYEREREVDVTLMVSWVIQRVVRINKRNLQRLKNFFALHIVKGFGECSGSFIIIRWPIT